MSAHHTDGRPELVIDNENPMIADLEALRAKHDLTGCVMLTFDGKGERVAYTAVGRTEDFARHMGRLGDQLLARIDDGDFDP